MTHLTFVNMSYTEHLAFSVKIAFNLLLLSMVGVIHAIFPFMFPSFVSSKVKDLDKMLDG